STQQGGGIVALCGQGAVSGPAAEGGCAGVTAILTEALFQFYTGASAEVEEAMGRPASILSRPRITVRRLARWRRLVVVACRSCRSWSATVSRRTSVTPILIGWECPS